MIALNPSPLITIGIPTYNRAATLAKNLEIIYTQIGNDPDFEVLIINNDSPDQTESVVMAFKNKYTNLTYLRNDSNIGADFNIYKVIEKSSGKYCLLHGDDDYFSNNSLQSIKSIIQSHLQCAIVFRNCIKSSDSVVLKQGMNEFLATATHGVTGMSALILEKSYFNKIKEPQKFLTTAINHMYLVYSILELNPWFVVINRPYLVSAQAPGQSYNWGKFMIKDYLDILYYFGQRGLNSKYIQQEKLRLLNDVLYWYKRLQEPGWNIDISQTMKYFKDYYKHEPYFRDYYARLIAINPKYN